MRRSLLAITFAVSLLAASCGGTDDAASAQTTPPTAGPTTTTSGVVATTQPTAPARNEDLAAFCQATTDFNATLVVSAFSDLAGEGSQDLYLLAKLPQLAALAATMAEAAPTEFAAEAATLEQFYRNATELAAERGLATTDLEAMAATIEAEQLTIEELYAELGLAPDDIRGLFEEAAAALGYQAEPVGLLGASPTDLGCPQPDTTVSACDLLGPEELIPILGDSYEATAKEIPEFGEECTLRGDSIAYVYVVLAGPNFYLPSVWNEITEIEGVGDEAFLTSGMSWPLLYAKQGNVVISVSVANTEPALTDDELAELARIALSRTGG